MAGGGVEPLATFGALAKPTERAAFVRFVQKDPDHSMFPVRFWTLGLIVPFQFLLEPVETASDGTVPVVLLQCSVQLLQRPVVGTHQLLYLAELLKEFRNILRLVTVKK